MPSVLVWVRIICFLFMKEICGKKIGSNLDQHAGYAVNFIKPQTLPSLSRVSSPPPPHDRSSLGRYERPLAVTNRHLSVCKSRQRSIGTDCPVLDVVHPGLPPAILVSFGLHSVRLGSPGRGFTAWLAKCRMLTLGLRPKCCIECVLRWPYRCWSPRKSWCSPTIGVGYFWHCVSAYQLQFEIISLPFFGARPPTFLGAHPPVGLTTVNPA